jgi:hypothetical protein
MTVASGRGLVTADEGRKMPVAVFYVVPKRPQLNREFLEAFWRLDERWETYGLWFESLDEDAVEQRDEGLDVFEGSGGLVCVCEAEQWSACKTGRWI